MGKLRARLTALVLRFFSGLRWPVLFCLVAVVFLVDLALPDVLPFADELLLGLLTLLLGAIRKRRNEQPDSTEHPRDAGPETTR